MAPPRKAPATPKKPTKAKQAKVAPRPSTSGSVSTKPSQSKSSSRIAASPHRGKLSSNSDSSNASSRISSLPAPKGRYKYVVSSNKILSKMTSKRYNAMRRLQNSTHLLLPRLPFSRVVKEVSQTFGNFRYQRRAILTLQEGAEYCLLRMFGKATMLSGHAKRVTLQASDIRLHNEICEDATAIC